MSKFYSNKMLLSHNATISFCMSGRGMGKSFDGKKTVIENYLKKGELSVYVRRYVSEIELVVETYWNDISKHYTDLEFKIVGDSRKGYKGLINGDIVVYFIALSTSSKLKSASYPSNVNFMIFDEYIITKSNFTRYLTNEMTLLNDLEESIFRPSTREKDDYKILILSNSVSYVNPFFTYYNIEVEHGKRFNKYINNLICLEIFESKMFTDEKIKSRFARRLQGSEQGREYSNYAIGNKTLEDNNDFITDRKSVKYEFVSSFTYNNFEVGVWQNLEDTSFFIDKKIDKSNPNRFALHSKDISTHNKLVKNYLKTWRIKYVKNAFYDGNIFYINQEVKKFAQEILIKYI